MLFQEEKDFINGLWEGLLDVDMVKDVGLVFADKATALDLGIVKVLAAVLAVEENAALAGHEPPLVFDEDPQALQHLVIDFASPVEIAPDGLAVERLGREVGHGQGVEADSGHAALQFGDELGVGLAVGGAQTDVGAVFQALGFEEMRAGAAEKDLHDEERLLLDADKFDIRDEARGNRIGDQVGQLLLGGKWVGDTDDFAIIRHSSPTGVLASSSCQSW